MPALCNFGESELPQAPPCDIELAGETQVEFGWRVRHMENKIKDMAEWDPSFQRKVDILCEGHSTDELERAVSDLKWEQIGVERKCWDNGMSPETMLKLETLMTRIAALQCAIEKKKEVDDEQHGRNRDQ